MERRVVDACLIFCHTSNITFDVMEQDNGDVWGCFLNESTSSLTCGVLHPGQIVQNETAVLCCKLTMIMPIQSLGAGVRCDDNATGQGYIMYTLQNSTIRFMAGKNDAQHFVCVQFSSARNSWIYVGDGAQYAEMTFIPRTTDIVIAQFDFGNSTETLTPILLDSEWNDLPAFNQMHQGYVSGDITIKADVYNGIILKFIDFLIIEFLLILTFYFPGMVDHGEFEVFGSYFLVDSGFFDLFAVPKDLEGLCTYYTIESVDRNRLRWNDTSGYGLDSISNQPLSYPELLSSLTSTVCVASAASGIENLGFSCELFGSVQDFSSSECPDTDALVMCWDTSGPQSNCLACDACNVLGKRLWLLAVARWNRILPSNEKAFVISVLESQFYEIKSMETYLLSDLAYSNVPKLETSPTIIRGSSFGTHEISSQGRIGWTSSETTKWHSDSGVSCHQTSGVKNTLLARVTSGYNLGSGSQFWTYDCVALSNQLLPSNNEATTGSGMLTVYGGSFGLVSYSQAYSFGVTSTSCESSTWVSDTSVGCKASQAVCSSLRVSVTAGSSASTFTVAFSIDLPLMSMPTSINYMGTASLSVTIFGQGFGFLDNTLKFVSGRTASELKVWESETW